jgi:hypothetical protein
VRQKEVLQRLSEINSEAIVLDNFQDALIGYTQNSFIPNVAVYDTEKCISILIEDGMTPEEAVEYFDFNVLGAYFGENNPIFVSL